MHRCSRRGRARRNTGVGPACRWQTGTVSQGQLSHRQIMVVYSGLMLGMLLAALDQTIVATALPTIVGDLGGLDHLSWVVTSYILASTISQPLYGKLGDLYGRKRLFQFAIVVFLVGSALCGISQNMGELIALPGAAGARRRRADGRRARDHRRHRPAARARPLPGLHGRRLRDRVRRRAAARRLLRRQPLLALGLLRQPAGRDPRARRDRRRAPELDRAPTRTGSTSRAPCSSRSAPAR